MQKDVIEGKGIVVDARLKSWFELETIPSAINIPFTTFQNLSKDKAEKIFKLLGMGINSDGSWDFRGLKRLVIFDNGLWCEQAKHLIDSMLEHGFRMRDIIL